MAQIIPSSDRLYPDICGYRTATETREIGQRAQLGTFALDRQRVARLLEDILGRLRYGLTA
jgi:hypothetical protein